MALAREKPPYLFTVCEYLTFERTAEERHEYLDGVMYAMAGESRNHGHICTNLTMLLATQLRGRPCAVFGKDTKVRSGLRRPNRRFTVDQLLGSECHRRLFDARWPCTFNDQGLIWTQALRCVVFLINPFYTDTCLII